MTKIDLNGAEPSLAHLVQALEDGSATEIMIIRAGKPVAQLMSIASPRVGQRVGVAEGLSTATSLMGLLKRPGQKALSQEEVNDAAPSRAPLHRILWMLDAAKLWYRLDRTREDAVLISVTAVGERCEITVCDDGTIETSRFLGAEDVTLGMDPVMSFLKRHEEPGAS